MAMTDAEVNEMVGKLRVAFGVKTTDDLVKEMASRFLCWKLPKDFAPDGGISFVESAWWPVGTNLLHAGQAEEMVRHMLGLPNVEIRGSGAEAPDQRSAAVPLSPASQG